jgi:hypothetical protein
MNTLERHKIQVNDALAFLAKAKFTNAENLQMVAQRQRRGFPTQLVKMGLLVSRKMAGGQSIYGLSKFGASIVGAPHFDIHKVSQGRVEHALIAQYQTLVAIWELGIIEYRFEPQEFLFDTRPDVIWVWSNGLKTFIEIELSSKTPGDGDLDKFFLKLLSRQTIVFFRDRVLLERYIEAARKYIKNGIPNWQQLDKKWVKFDDFTMFEEDAWRGVEFRLHKQDFAINLVEIYGEVKAIN